MTYGAIVTFDLKNASSADYNDAYNDLAAHGLHRAQANNLGGQTVIPTTTVFGAFNGADAGSVRDYVRTLVKNAFAARRFTSEIFVLVGGQDWQWGATTT